MVFWGAFDMMSSMRCRQARLPANNPLPRPSTSAKTNARGQEEMEATAATRKSRRLRRKPTAVAADALVSLAATPSWPASAASGALPVSESL